MRQILKESSSFLSRFHGQIYHLEQNLCRRQEAFLARHQNWPLGNFSNCNAQLQWDAASKNVMLNVAPTEEFRARGWTINLSQLAFGSNRFFKQFDLVSYANETWLVQLQGKWNSGNEGCALTIESTNGRKILLASNVFKFVCSQQHDRLVIVWTEIFPKKTFANSVKSATFNCVTSTVEKGAIAIQDSLNGSFYDIAASFDKQFLIISTSSAGQLKSQSFIKFKSLVSSKSPQLTCSSTLLPLLLKNSLSKCDINQFVLDIMNDQFVLLMFLKSRGELLQSFWTMQFNLDNPTIAKVFSNVSQVYSVENLGFVVTDSANNNAYVYDGRVGSSFKFNRKWVDLYRFSRSSTQINAIYSLPLSPFNETPASELRVVHRNSAVRTIQVGNAEILFIGELGQSENVHCIYYDREISSNTFRPDVAYLLEKALVPVAIIYGSAKQLKHSLRRIRQVLKPDFVSLTTWSSGSSNALRVVLQSPALVDAVHFRAPDFSKSDIRFLTETKSPASMAFAMVTASVDDVRINLGRALDVANFFASSHKVSRMGVPKAVVRICKGSHSRMEKRRANRQNYGLLYSLSHVRAFTNDFDSECAGSFELISEELFWILQLNSEL